jgi:hypothetical protein
VLSRKAVTKICRFLMMSTMLPPPSAMMRPTRDSCANVWRSLSPLPPKASAVLSMNRAIEVLDTLLRGPRSVASRVNWVLTSSHSTGTAVRSTGITAPSRIVGPLEE